MPHIASAITEEINSIHDYSTIPTLTEENKNLVVTLDEKADTEFIEAVKKQVIRKELIEKVGKEVVNGVGNVAKETVQGTLNVGKEAIKTGANIGKETINTGKKVGKAVKDTVKEGK